MKPVTDNYKISKEKLAYLIDATAAPICIIAPISAWAAAVAGFAPEGQNGIALFCSAIPYNFYALFTIGMMIILSIFSLDFGPMKKFEAAVAKITEKDKDRDNKDKDKEKQREKENDKNRDKDKDKDK